MGIRRLTCGRRFSRARRRRVLILLVLLQLRRFKTCHTRLASRLSLPYAENLFDSVCACVRVVNINNFDALLRPSTPSLPRSSFQVFIAPGPCSHSRRVFLELSLPQPKISQLTLNTSRPLRIHLYLVMPFYCLLPKVAPWSTSEVIFG